MATSVLGLKTFAASDPVDVNEVNDNYTKIDNGVKTAMQGRAAHNWFDNSDFSIAQAGYGGKHGSKTYACDRWYDTYGYGSFSFSKSQGLTVAYGTNHAYLVQKINGASLLHGKTVTIALKLSDGTVYAKSGVFNSSGGSIQIVISSGNTFTLYADRAELVVTTGSVTLKWAALYEGSYTADTLPAYVPKDNELAECMRYYYRSNDSNSGQDGMIIRRAINVGNSTESFSLESVDLPVPMRITPTITVFDVHGNKNYVQEWYSNDQVGNTSIRYANNRRFCVASEIGAFIGGKSYYFHYEASADL